MAPQKTDNRNHFLLTSMDFTKLNDLLRNGDFAIFIQIQMDRMVNRMAPLANACDAEMARREILVHADVPHA